MVQIESGMYISGCMVAITTTSQLLGDIDDA